MTDEEILKAFECCCGDDVNGTHCKDCPAEKYNFDWCSDEVSRQMVDYTKRLQAENAALRERLSKAYEFPVKYGDRIWVIGKSHLFDRYVWGIEIKNNGIFLSLSDKTMWYDRGIVPLSECGKTWFLDSEKELAEARLNELQGNNNNGN